MIDPNVPLARSRPRERCGGITPWIPRNTRLIRVSVTERLPRTRSCGNAAVSPLALPRGKTLLDKRSSARSVRGDCARRHSAAGVASLVFPFGRAGMNRVSALRNSGSAVPTTQRHYRAMMARAYYCVYTAGERIDRSDRAALLQGPCRGLSTPPFIPPHSRRQDR